MFFKKNNDSLETLVNEGYRYALALSHRKAEAEDLVQETAARLIRHYGKIPNRKVFYRSIRNLYYD